MIARNVFDNGLLMKKRLVLELKKGGLGDHLFYSHIPRIAKESGAYEEVLISNRSIFRNEAYRNLIWELNPFVDGFTDEPGLYYQVEKLNGNENLLDSLMLLYGLDDGKRWHEPELFYTPEKQSTYQNCTIYDPNYISYTGDLTSGQLIQNWLKETGITIDFQMQKLNQRFLTIEEGENMKTGSILDLCSLIVSCKRMYCLTTGTATLAAALHVPVTVFYGTGHELLYRHSKLHEYVHVGTDYNFIDKVKKRVVLFLRKFLKLGVR